MNEEISLMKCITFIFIIYCSHALVAQNWIKRAVSDHNINKSWDERKWFWSSNTPTIKYVLMWDPSDKTLSYFGEGNNTFVNRKCQHQNCHMTVNRSLLKNESLFDAVMFDGVNLAATNHSLLPMFRSNKQKYIFASLEPASLYPVCDPFYNEYFNWKFTYRLDSEVRWNIIGVFEETDELSNETGLISPNLDIKWPEKYYLSNKKLPKIIKNKSKAAAWFVTECVTSSRRERLFEELSIELTDHGMSVDVYGTCTHNEKCRIFDDKCMKMLNNDYFFYFAFENAIDIDYVTEDLLIALKSWCVPVVYGGADYSRFMPPGSYLDASEMNVPHLVYIMEEIMQNPKRYLGMLQWKSNYTFRVTTREDVCHLCDELNDDDAIKSHQRFNNFRLWWNSDITLCYTWQPLGRNPVPPPHSSPNILFELQGLGEPTELTPYTLVRPRPSPHTFYYQRAEIPEYTLHPSPAPPSTSAPTARTSKTPSRSKLRDSTSQAPYASHCPDIWIFSCAKILLFKW